MRAERREQSRCLNDCECIPGGKRGTADLHSHLLERPAISVATPGAPGRPRRSGIYGRLDCPLARRAISRGGYVRHRVFFPDESTAIQAGYRPCAVCMRREFSGWKLGAIHRKENRMNISDPAVARLLARIEKTWDELQQSISGLSDAQLTEPRTMDEWSVRDVLAHITTWEEQTLEHLPTIMAGGRTPKYLTFGGIDAFNGMMTEKKRGLSLAEILRQMSETHERLIDLVRSAPAEQLNHETRARRRLRWDTFQHYAEHAKAIRDWRERSQRAEPRP
jgi:uncharacterized protein (TIGR03083 family)